MQRSKLGVLMCLFSLCNIYKTPPTPCRHTPTPSCEHECIHTHTNTHTPRSCKHLNKAALAATTLLSPRISQSPHGGRGPAANQFPTNNNDPKREIQNRKQLIKTCFMSVFLYNERPLVFLSVHRGRLKKGASRERERRKESLALIHTVPCNVSR